MKLLLISLVTVFSATALAIAPTVKCSPIYQKFDAHGVETDESGGPALFLGQNSTAHQDTQGFTIDAKMEPVCAADGGACVEDAALLTVKMTKQGSPANSSLIMIVTSDNYARVTTVLQDGPQNVLLNCDLNRR